MFTLFSLRLIFTNSTLVAANISHFLTTATKFSCCSCRQKCLLCLLSLALALCRSFSLSLTFTRWKFLLLWGKCNMGMLQINPPHDTKQRFVGRSQAMF